MEPLLWIHGGNCVLVGRYTVGGQLKINVVCMHVLECVCVCVCVCVYAHAPLYLELGS